MEAAWEEQGWAVVRPALRVLQLDASRLDRLLVDMLQRQLVQSVSPLEWLLEARKHDVSFVLSTLLYVLTVARTGATYGQRLLNLRYHSGQMNIARTTILIHYGCTVLLPWCWRRGTEVLADAPEAARVRYASVVRRLEKVLVVATYANHLVFLCNGQFLSLADRVSGLETVFDKELPRRITYDILSRELLWHGFSEFAVFVLPHVNIKRWWAAIRHFFGRARGNQRPTFDQHLAIAPNAKCAECGAAPPWTPYTAGCCDEVYCYYCVSALAHASGQVECKSCFSTTPRTLLRPCRTTPL
eukprot:m.29345 g.29345  ORF g.29345 m.29345 type:complete len:300 (+) comp6673_c0_seq1:4692-5591(+)